MPTLTAQRLLCVAPFALLTAFPGLALGQDPATDATVDETDETDTARAAAYTGAEDDPASTDAAAAFLSNLSLPVAPDAALAHISSLVDPDTLAILGARAVDSCAGAPVTPPAYRAQLETLVELTETLEDMLYLAEEVRAARACLTEPISPAELARPDFLAGMEPFSELGLDPAEVSKAAEDAFTAALAVDPDFAWDPDYPPNAQLSFADAKMRLLSSPPAILRFSLPDGTTVVVDGLAVDDPLAGVDIVAGQHLAQWRVEPKGAWQSRLVTVEGPSTVLVLDPATLSAAGGPESRAVERCGALFAALAAEGRDVPGYLVDLSAGPAAFRWDPVTGSLEAMHDPDDSPHVVPLGVRFQRAGGGLAITGAGTIVAGAVMAGAGRARRDELDREMETSGYDPDLHEQRRRMQRLHQAGWIVLAGGAAALAAGIPLIAHGVKLERDGGPATRVGLTPTPDGLWLQVEGRF